MGEVNTILPKQDTRLQPKYLLDIDVSNIKRFEEELLEEIDTKYPEIPEKIRTTKVLDEETEKKLIEAITKFKEQFK